MIDKLEQKFGKYAIKNLIYYILGAYVIGYILALAKPDWYQYIVLSPALVMRGQIWRLFTWVCTAPQSLGIFTIFMFLFYYFIGKSLEQSMGAFKYNLYIFSGWLFTTLGAMIFYWISGITLLASTHYINLTSFLAFALLYPEHRVLFFGLIPVRMKILAWIDAVYLILQVLSGFIIAVASTETVTRALQVYYGYPPSALEVTAMRESSISLMVTILISMLNFLIYFLIVIRRNTKNKQRRDDFQKRAQSGRQAWTQETETRSGWGFRETDEETGKEEPARHRPEPKKQYSSEDGGTLVHTCEICGRTNITNPELMFRYCSRCEGNHEYCQDHLFTHEHVHKA